MTSLPDLMSVINLRYVWLQIESASLPISCRHWLCTALKGRNGHIINPKLAEKLSGCVIWKALLSLVAH